LVDDEAQNELPVAFCTFSDHTLTVTDIQCGIGTFPSCRILTSSIDHSVKVSFIFFDTCTLFLMAMELWDVSSRSLLTTFQFPRPITSLVWDSTERLFFAASKDGYIHQMNLFRQRETKAGGQYMEAVGGGGVSDIVRVGEEGNRANKKRLISVG
jgi:pre-rRNA-processing protein IPI3